MRKIVSAGLFLLVAATNVATAQDDTKAKAILDGVSKKVAGMKSMKANFVLNLSGGKVKDSKKGTFALKGEKYHVMLSGQEIICDNKTVWTYNKEAKEVQVTAYNPSEQTISPAKLFTNAYSKEYKYKYKGEQKEKGKTYEVIELMPIDNTKKFTKIELKVDKATSMVSSGDIWDKNGTRIQYLVSDFVQNANLPDSYFSWDAKANPGVEVVDLR